MCALDLNLAYQFTKIKADVQIKLTFKDVFSYLYHEVKFRSLWILLAVQVNDSIYIRTNSLSSIFINFMSIKNLMQ